MSLSSLTKRLAGGLLAASASRNEGTTGNRPRLVVHFGSHKTGSSSIQATLHANAGPDKGFVYLDLGAANGSALLQNAFVEPEKLLSLRAAELRRDHAETVRKKARARLRRAIGANLHVSPGVPLIISGESISGFSDDEVAGMVEFFREFPVDLEFIGYIREPASYLRSSFQQVIKARLPASSLFDRAKLDKLHCSYHGIVKRLDALVGPERVHAFAFDPAGFPQGNVVLHFLAALGIDAGPIKVVKQNESLSLLAVKLLYIYRRFCRENDGVLGSRDTRLAFAADLSRIEDVAFDLHPELVHTIAERNRHIFDWAATRLDRPLPAAGGKSAGGVLTEADLLSLSADDLAKFAEYAARFGIDDAGQSAEPAAIAARMDLIRKSYI